MKVVSSVLPNEELEIDIKRKFSKVEFHFYKGIDEAKDNLTDADIFITFGNDLTEEIVKSAKNLKWIMVMSAGIEDIPLLSCKEKGIIVTNARGIHKVPMSEFVIGLMLQYEKKAKQLWLNEQKNKWDRKLEFGELYGKTILILGTGAIGSEIARLAKAFNMETIGVNRRGRSVAEFDQIYTFQNIENILPKAHYVVSVLPSTAETKYIIKETHFDLMKDEAVFCNIGRGDVVEEHVLLKVLENKKIAHAFLDVFENEPLKEDDPLWKMDNVTITPHISSVSAKYLPRAFEIFEQNLTKFLKDDLKNKLINQINFEKGY